jgi:hypothetical protein
MQCHYSTYLTPIYMTCYANYRVIHNSLTHFTKSAHLNGGKECNIRHTDGKKNTPSFSWMPHKSFYCLTFVTRQTSSPLSVSAHTRRSWSPGPPDLRSCDFSNGVTLSNLSLYRLYHKIYLSCKDESSLPSQKSIVT